MDRERVQSERHAAVEHQAARDRGARRQASKIFLGPAIADANEAKLTVAASADGVTAKGRPEASTAITKFSQAENLLHSSVLVVRGRSAGNYRSRIISRPRVTSNAMTMATRNHRCDDAHDVLARRPRRRTRNVLASRCNLRCRGITHLNILRAFCRHHEKMLFTKERSRRANR